MTGVVVAVASAGSGGGKNVATSPDGTTWTEHSTMPTHGAGGQASWQGICFSPSLNLFCAVANDGTANDMATSPDGVTWTGSTSGGSGWAGVCWADTLGLFVAVGNGTNKVATSPDGSTWTLRTASEANPWVAVCWAHSLGLLVAVAGTGTHQIMTSPDGITWTNRTHINGGYTCCCWDPVLAKFCILGSSSNSELSSDGITWTSYLANLQGGTTHSVAPYPSGGFQSGGNNHAGHSATGQASWTDQTVGNGTTIPGLCYSPAVSLFVFTINVSTFGIGTSPDGVTFTQRSLDTTNIWVALANGIAVAPPFTQFKAMVFG